MKIIQTNTDRQKLQRDTKYMKNGIRALIPKVRFNSTRKKWFK